MDKEKLKKMQMSNQLILFFDQKLPLTNLINYLPIYIKISSLLTIICPIILIKAYIYIHTHTANRIATISNLITGTFLGQLLVDLISI